MNVLKETRFKLPGQQSFYRGKVRDVYDMGDSLLLVATDRYSAFDRNLALVPDKGQLLTAISRYWFEQTSDIIKNHVIDYPDPNVVRCKKYQVVPIEVVVRGYISGVTNTSLWQAYSNGQRDFGDFTLAEGLHKNQRLPQPVLTPTTKFEKHDRPLTAQEAVDEALVDGAVWEQLQRIALKLFDFGQKTAADRGLILVDTKYEFGQDDRGNIILIDEAHTPDSSRYWRADTYAEKIEAGEEPDNYDKEFLRLWFKQRFDPYSDEAAPEAPANTIAELRRRYSYVYEQLSSETFRPRSGDLLAQIESNILKSLAP